MVKLNANQIRKSTSKIVRQHFNDIQRNPIVIVLDNVLDTYNIGSFFRLADALAASKIFLCGPTYTPPNIKIHRSSIGTWKWVPWQHYQQTSDCIDDLKRQGYQIVSCELDQNSIPYNKAKYKFPLAIVAGSESLGVDKDILKKSDIIVEIPMHGINKSLNTLTAASIISYQAISSLNNT